MLEKNIRIESFSLEGLERLVHRSEDMYEVSGEKELESALSVLREVKKKEDTKKT